MADNILQIFSNFDGRFSREKLASEDKRTRSCAALELSLKSMDRRISQYVAADHQIWSYSADSAVFLDLIDDLIATIGDWTPMVDDKSIGVCLVRAEDLM
ncbi:hypothetical protein C1H46_005727 [Malus baccata]|uniref:Uncharacterized protein n=1 Tax=Malus baccata TaxID=106549 RepID=A0A540NC58_MALBA|nr:hypothetical protein C1H46_005727 [Malus baccata]